jgi:diaminopimelate decarboxylase
MPHTLKDVLPATARLRDDGHLEVGGCDLVNLAAEFGTPVYVFCEETFRRQARRYRDAFPAPDRVYYAAKAFTSLSAFRMATEEGLGVDCATGGELHVALAADVPPRDIIVHGNNKSDAELEMAVTARVGRVAVDSLDELERLARIAETAGIRQAIVLRVTPNVSPSSAHTRTSARRSSARRRSGSSSRSWWSSWATSGARRGSSSVS